MLFHCVRWAIFIFIIFMFFKGYISSAFMFGNLCLELQILSDHLFCRRKKKRKRKKSHVGYAIFLETFSQIVGTLSNFSLHAWHGILFINSTHVYICLGCFWPLRPIIRSTSKPFQKPFWRVGRQKLKRKNGLKNIEKK